MQGGTVPVRGHRVSGLESGGLSGLDGGTAWTGCDQFRFNDFTSFNPLSKVLFIFPSQYLCAIGLPPVFSLRRCLSPA
jgi:hypothetical protein